jgi:hypothetical protein
MFVSYTDLKLVRVVFSDQSTLLKTCASICPAMSVAASIHFTLFMAFHFSFSIGTGSMAISTTVGRILFIYIAVWMTSPYVL